jgi:hypothetical protein
MNRREVARTLGKRIVLTYASLADFRMTKQKVIKSINRRIRKIGVENDNHGC